jgi:hypothetical protein
MNQIVENVLTREAAKARAGSETLSILILFCSLGLLASLCLYVSGLRCQRRNFLMRLIQVAVMALVAVMSVSAMVHAKNVITSC